ncbi:hypothetical protein KIW84_021587 [Lathyrus oleraceus]|uniref:Uncharacterized protein n=1 Tax=Pisum sativum TaxID=3888 RepID=A0A9D5B9K2_PEA|nr:hypothetical protein KIW84_021587 [Pisum sativum]
MDIHPAYSCLLGRPWIHEAGTVTSTLHQKLKFVKNGKLVIVGGEKALLVSHMSSFSYVEAEEEVGTPFQALSITEWGCMVEVAENKNKAGLGFQQRPSNVKAEYAQPSFRSGGFIHGNEEHLASVIEGDEDEDCDNFVTHKKTRNNWVAVDVPVIIELVNLGSEDDVKEVKIRSQLCPEVKKGLIDLLRGYSDVFAWSYQDMSGLDSEIVEHRLSLKPECPPVKQKLRRTHLDMAVKIKEEVQK